jgi:hypothetical protein
MGPTLPQESNMPDARPLHPSDEELVRLLIQLQSSPANPALLPEDPIELNLSSKEANSDKKGSPAPKRTWTVKKEDELPSPPSRSPPASPRLYPVSHLMVLRNGRELRRKIS